MSSLYADLLDAGDRLAEALDAGDLDGVAEAIAERAALLAAPAADRPRPSPEMRDRFQAQDARLRALLEARLAEAGAAASRAGRDATAHGRYHATPSAPVLDTAPRRGA